MNEKKRRITVKRRFVPIVLSVILTAAMFAGVAVSGWADEPPQKSKVTPMIQIPDHAKVKKYYEIPNFRIGGTYNLDADPETWRNGGEGGTTLESLGAGPLQVAYIAVGTPKRNGKGEITNAVIISTFYSGDSAWMYNTWYEGQPLNAFSGGAVVGPGRTIDTEKYYVVFLDAIGLWGASKPSLGLGASSQNTTTWTWWRQTTDFFATI